ncbi:MAG: hypothetical protein WKF77_20895 [Planctomycetaceae bacterium]
MSPHARVDATDLWAPRGLCDPDEAKLGESPEFLSDGDRRTITGWWLAISGRANTPNWDLVSKCHIEGKPGLILIEAKAHEGELGDDRCGATNKDNFERIKLALSEANVAWNALLPGFNLSSDTHYQLSNRFAFAWKVAAMGTPVVLVYLGFLNAHEMKPPYKLLRTAEDWHGCVLAKSARTIPAEVWGRTFHVNGTSMTVLIRSAAVEVMANADSGELSR